PSGRARATYRDRDLHGARPMIRAAGVCAGIALAATVLVPASAGTSTPRPRVSLTASPAHVTLVGRARATVRVTNSGMTAVTVDSGRAGFALDLRGHPRIVSPGLGSRAAASWLTLRPRRFARGPGASEAVTISSRLPP